MKTDALLGRSLHKCGRTRINESEISGGANPINSVAGTVDDLAATIFRSTQFILDQCSCVDLLSKLFVCRRKLRRAFLNPHFQFVTRLAQSCFSYFAPGHVFRKVASNVEGDRYGKNEREGDQHECLDACLDVIAAGDALCLI